MNDYNNFVNVLAHEMRHIRRKHNDPHDVNRALNEYGLAPLEHAKVYLDQISHESYPFTTDEFKSGMARSFIIEMKNAFEQNIYTDEAIFDAISSFNKASIDYKINARRVGAGAGSVNFNVDKE